MKKLLLALGALTLAACATPSDPVAMTVAATAENTVSSESGLYEAVAVGRVEGGQETNPLLESEVSSEDFATALSESLRAHAMLSTESGTYRLDANLREMNQPFVGLNMTVSSTVFYTLTNVETGEVVYEELVAESYTATMGDAMVGVTRLRLANEGSIRANIERMLSDIVEVVDG